MTKYINKSFLTLFFIAAIFIGVQLFLSSYFSKFLFVLTFSVLYLWSPGLTALFYSYKEGLKLTVFKHPNRYLYWACLSSIGISLLAFLLTIPFGSINTFNPDLARPSFLQQFRSAFFYFLNYYFLFIAVHTVVFLGGELYWRGYLWEKLKSKPFQAVWIISFLWSLWTIPLLLFPVVASSYGLLANLLRIVILNFALTPILLYYRIKSKSILTPALFCSFLLVTPVISQLLFPSFREHTELFFKIAVGLLVLYSLFLKLYSKAFWKHALTDTNG